MAMTFGRMRDVIRIVRRVTTAQRADGGYDTRDVVVAERRANVAPLSGREDEEADRLRHSQNYLVTMLAKGLDIRPQDHFVWVTGKGRVLNVREVRNPPAGTLYCEIVAEAGAVT